MPWVPSITIQPGGDGRTIQATLYPLIFQTLGKTSVIPIEKAREAVENRNPDTPVYVDYHPSREYASIQEWSRSYSPPSQQVSIYGRVQIFYNESNTLSPKLFLNGIELSGNPGDILGQVQQNELIHIWGDLLSEPGDTSVRLSVQGWEDSPLEEQTLTGYYSRLKGDPTLILEDGTSYSLLDPPADLAEGTHVKIIGVLSDARNGIFDWAQMNSLPEKTIELPAELLQLNPVVNIVWEKLVLLNLHEPESEQNQGQKGLQPFWMFAGTTNERDAIIFAVPAAR
jgi:hypothetical protein